MAKECAKQGDDTVRNDAHKFAPSPDARLVSFAIAQTSVRLCARCDIGGRRARETIIVVASVHILFTLAVTRHKSLVGSAWRSSTLLSSCGVVEARALIKSRLLSGHAMTRID